MSIDGVTDFKVVFDDDHDQVNIVVHLRLSEGAPGPATKAEVRRSLDTIPALAAETASGRVSVELSDWEHLERVSFGHCQARDSSRSGDYRMILDIAETAMALLERDESFARVSILDTQGSSPRHTGASMLVRGDGSITGTIGGGPLEATCITQAVDAVRARRHNLVRFDSGDLGMACGGGGHVLIEYVDAKRPQEREVYDAVLRLWRDGGRGWLVTALPREDETDVPVRRCLVDSTGSVTGDPVCTLDDLRALARRGGTYDALVAEDPARIHVQPIGTRGRVYVFGAGHCGRSLVPVLSSLSFFTVVIDDRPDFASPERFPAADRIEVPASFDGVLKTLPIDDDSYLVIVTRGHSHDQTVLAQALETPAVYIGMIGSKKKVAGTLEALSKRGFSANDLARVHAPIGLSIGAETPEEIAISIAAELIQVRSTRDA